MKVKICGITDLNTALMAVESGADAIGFVFAESKRRIAPDKAKGIIEHLPESVLKVGVFVNERKERVQEIVDEIGINIIQLHGDESPEFCSGFSVPVAKAISINVAADLLKIEKYSCDYILLDSPIGKYRGGNGIAFDWKLLNEYQLIKKKLILAGGLTSENVAQGIKIAKPYMVDVSSGVETGGQKDLEKINSFIKEAKKSKGGS